jgi:hypothetical protein
MFYSLIKLNFSSPQMNLVAQSSEQPITDDNNPPKFDDLGQITMPLNGFLYIKLLCTIFRLFFVAP